MQDCRKFEKSLLDAALGALAPERERAFAAHIARCEACRKAFEQAQQFALALDRGVASLVSDEPSPHFAARLRARIAAEQPAPRFARLEWKPAAAVAVASILAVAGIVWMAKHRNPAPTVASSAREIASVRTASSPVSSAQNQDSGTPASSQARSSLSAGAPTEPGRAGSSQPAQPGDVAVARLVPRRRDARPRAHSPAEPEVIVPPGQLEAVMRLAAASSSGRIDGKQLIAAQKGTERPLAIQLIEIKPIEIPPTGSEPATPAEPPVSSSNH